MYKCTHKSGEKSNNSVGGKFRINKNFRQTRESCVHIHETFYNFKQAFDLLRKNITNGGIYMHVFQKTTVTSLHFNANIRESQQVIPVCESISLSERKPFEYLRHVWVL